MYAAGAMLAAASLLQLLVDVCIMRWLMDMMFFCRSRELQL